MSKTSAEIVEEYYNYLMFKPNTLQNKLGFLNIGYWRGVEEFDSVEFAQINLIETLVRFFTNTRGNVLDVACGKGASTKYLTKYFDPTSVTGINISERQLDIARMTAPECQFRIMDATQLAFEDRSIDNVLCIEAAFHFMTRARFFSEAYRVLRPAGRLAVSDILFSPTAHEMFPSFFKENFLPHLDAYREQLRSTGFTYIRVEESTDVSIDALLRVVTQRYERDLDNVHLQTDYKALMEFMQTRPTFCMAYAVK